jgi:hypothetical protein
MLYLYRHKRLHAFIELFLSNLKNPIIAIDGDGIFEVSINRRKLNNRSLTVFKILR